MERKSYTRKILKGLLLTGCIYIAASNPYFSLHLVENIKKELKKRRLFKEKEKSSSFDNTLYYLKRKGYLDIRTKNKQVYISLTEEGKEKAGKYLINALKIKKPKVWDKKWRIVIFDIPNLTKIKRDAFRGKLKELGFYMFQRSVWIYPYDCQKEIELLREFFGLSRKEMQLVIGQIKEDIFLQKRFRL